MILTGPRARPAVLLGAGFQYRHSSIREALSAAVGS